MACYAPDPNTFWYVAAVVCILLAAVPATYIVWRGR